MHHTIFDTPLVNTFLRGVSLTVLRVTGWRVEGTLPSHATKSVLIAAPHTSNWDLPYTLMLAFVDYERKVGGLGPVFIPTGDLEQDMRAIKAFYAPIKGKNAAQFEA